MIYSSTRYVVSIYLLFADYKHTMLLQYPKLNFRLREFHPEVLYPIEKKSLLITAQSHFYRDQYDAKHD